MNLNEKLSLVLMKQCRFYVKITSHNNVFNPLRRSRGGETPFVMTAMGYNIEGRPLKGLIRPLKGLIRDVPFVRC